MTEQLNTIERAATFGRVLFKTLGAGGVFAEQAIVQKRFDVCSACEHFRPDEGPAGTCAVCRCDLKSELGSRWLSNLMNKLAHVDSRCPIDKW